jgi:hypothetical protein
MKSLHFSVGTSRRASAASGRVREARFEPRSSLPIAAACVVANGVRESLATLLRKPVALRLVEPVIPLSPAWDVVTGGARLYRVNGNVADAAIVLRAVDAGVLAAALFGEGRESLVTGPLSPMECDVLDRMAATFATNFAAVCGARESPRIERVLEIRDFTTYFELVVEEPAARIGIALSRDPAPEARGGVSVGHLAGVKLAARAALDLGTIEAGAVARLGVGSMLPFESAQLGRCTLRAGRQRFARGVCGVCNGRLALLVDATHEVK